MPPLLPQTPRSRYRAVALAVAHEPPANGLPEAPFLAAKISLTDVANALEVSRSALYKLWDSQYDFWVDLSRYLAYDLDFSQDDHDMPWQEARRITPELPHLAEEEVAEACRSRGGVAQDLVLADTRVLVRAASLGYPDIADIGEIRQAVEARRLHHLSTDVATTLALLRRTPTTPSGEHDIAAMMWCISDELSVVAHYLPEVVTQPVPLDLDLRFNLSNGPADWSYLALAAWALYLGLSAPGTRDPPLVPPPPPPAIPKPSDLWSSRQLAALDAATERFVEAIESPSDDRWLSPEGPTALGHVTVARVARAAGVSRRTIYNVWPTRRAMMTDVLDDLLAEHVDTILAAVQHRATASPEGFGLAALTEELVGPAGTAPAVQPWLGSVIEPHDETVRSALRAMHTACTVKAVGYLNSWMAIEQRRPCPGLEASHLALLWLSLIRGGQRLRRTSPGTSTAFGAAAEALLGQLTIPV